MNKCFSAVLALALLALAAAPAASAGDLLGESWQKNWTEKEKAQYKLFLGLQAADAITTIAVLNGGGEEINPLYGRNPGAGKIAAIKAASNLAIWWMLDNIPRGKKGTILNVLNIVTGAVVVNNGMVALGVRF